jgi:hypothetical protein
MTAWLNFSILRISTCLFLCFCALSVSPAAFEIRWGPVIWRRMAVWLLAILGAS